MGVRGTGNAIIIHWTRSGDFIDNFAYGGILFNNRGAVEENEVR
jgi:hypothetical protein